MIIVPSKFVYVGSPRTGSHFIYNVLQKHFPDAYRSGEHHAFIAEVLNQKRIHGLPVYTIVREPVEHLFSFYWNSLHKYPDRIVETTFTEFIEARKPPNTPYRKAIDFPPGALATYRYVADKFFPFEKDFKRLFVKLGVDDFHGVEPTRVATDAYLEARGHIKESDKLLVRKYFKKDYQLYRDTCSS